MALKSVPNLQYFPFRSKRSADAAKREATRQTQLAIWRGVIKKQPCGWCGSRKSEAHHEDYRQPLAVMWLCRKHHRQRDRELRDGALRMTTQSPAMKPIRKYHRAIAPEASVDLVRVATATIYDAMIAQGLSENAYAKRMGVSRQWLNYQFHGGIRSLRGLHVLATALNCDVRIELAPRGAQDQKSA